MKPQFMTATIALTCLALFARPSRADEDAPPAAAPAPAPAGSKIKLYGNLTVERDKDGKVTKVLLTSVNRVEYRVVLDETGLKLVAEMAGKRAQVLGTYVTQDAVRTLTVQSYSAVEKDPKKVAPKKPVAKRHVPKPPRPPARKTTTKRD